MCISHEARKFDWQTIFVTDQAYDGRKRWLYNNHTDMFSLGEGFPRDEGSYGWPSAAHPDADQCDLCTMAINAGLSEVSSGDCMPHLMGGGFSSFKFELVGAGASANASASVQSDMEADLANVRARYNDPGGYPMIDDDGLYYRLKRDGADDFSNREYAPGSDDMSGPYYEHVESNCGGDNDCEETDDNSSELVRLLNMFEMGECAGKFDTELGVTDIGDVAFVKINEMTSIGIGLDLATEFYNGVEH